MTLFREKIREQIANQPLQAALDANAERRLRGRLASFASLPDPQERRQRAHSVRAEVIAHLDEYLADFTAKAQNNGITVHPAQDGTQAVQTILEVIAATPRRRDPGSPGGQVLVAKSKSMVSEEIELNHALEAAGHRVVETDLGEYIVQLRGERPAHIITPAVHLRRHEVGALFHKKLGIPYTEDIPTLTQAARRVLRQVFLEADAGISGVNFGVAETGGLCIVTNEGNGRMVTTLPPVHIALLGIERLVPTLDDLALMLSVLPRSATGQKLSVYTQLLQRPLDGQQRHIILLDNGRRAVRESPLAEALYCIRCGACLNACPVFREIGGHGYLGVTGKPVTYSGPIGSVISAGLLGGDEFGNLAQASSLCGACKEACPVDIDLPKLLLRVRAGQAPVISHPPAGTSQLPVASRQSPVTSDQSPVTKERSSGSVEAGGVGLSRTVKMALSLYAWTAWHPRLFALAQTIAGWASVPLPETLRLPAITGWGLSKDLPKPAARSFRSRWREESKEVAGRQVESRHVESGWVRSGGTEDRPMENIQVASGDETLPGSLDTQSLVDSFVQELKAVAGHVQRVDSTEMAPQMITLLKSRGIERIHLQPGILDEAELGRSGVQVTHEPDPLAKAGVTMAVCGLADTGSILVSDGPGDPLQASLLPEIHIAVLRAGDILPSLADALALPQVSAAAATAVITGPSRTGDIEMTHTIGVHGPGEVHVFVVDG